MRFHAYFAHKTPWRRVTASLRVGAEVGKAVRDPIQVLILHLCAPFLANS